MRCSRKPCCVQITYDSVPPQGVAQRFQVLHCSGQDRHPRELATRRERGRKWLQDAMMCNQVLDARTSIAERVGCSESRAALMWAQQWQCINLSMIG